MAKKKTKIEITDPRLREQGEIMATFAFGEVVKAIINNGHEAVVVDRNNGKFVSFKPTKDGIECYTGTSTISEVDLEAMAKDAEARESDRKDRGSGVTPQARIKEFEEEIKYRERERKSCPICREEP